jgi:hypothetical protein
MEEIVKLKQVAEKIIVIRGQSVMLDSDVASLYGVETMHINEAVKNNPDKFPEGYVFELSKEEKKELIENLDNPKVKFSPSLPKAFTEKGLYMLATIPKSPRATQTTIAIVETFAKIRELARTISQLSESPDESGRKTLMQKGDDIITNLLGDDLHATDTETTFEIIRN